MNGISPRPHETERRTFEDGSVEVSHKASCWCLVPTETAEKPPGYWEAKIDEYFASQGIY